MARKRRTKDYEDKQAIRDTPKQKADRPRLTPARAKDDFRQAGRQEGSPGILVFAVLAVTLFIGFYYHILALQGMQQLTGGMSMLDHHLSGFTVPDVERLGPIQLGTYHCGANLPGHDGAERYRHWTVDTTFKTCQVGRCGGCRRLRCIGNLGIDHP